MKGRGCAEGLFDRKRQAAFQVMMRGICLALALSVEDGGDGMLKEGGRGRIFMYVVVLDDCDVDGIRRRSVGHPEPSKFD